MIVAFLVGLAMIAGWCLHIAYDNHVSVSALILGAVTFQWLLAWALTWARECLHIHYDSEDA